MTVTLYQIAERFIGAREVSGHASNPAILAMLRLDESWPEGDDVPWCSAALNYWCWLLRLPRSKSLAARSWLGVGTVVALDDAAEGFDVVVLSRPGAGPTAGHVGLYAGRDGDTIYLLGGNQSDRVCVAPFAASRVLGVRRLA